MNKPILITGASGGIGLELVQYLLNSEYNHLFCIYKNNKTELEKLVNKNRIYRADLTRESDINAVRDDILSKTGSIWGLVNLAGYSSNAISWKLPRSEFRKAIDNNLLTTFLTCRAFIPDMKKQGGGRIINISSVTAFKGIVGACHYASAKAGIIGLTKSLAMETVKDGITVNALVLGYFAYGMINQIPPDILEKIKHSIPMGRLGEIEEMGGMVKLLLDNHCSYITGQAIHINGGLY